MNPRSRTQSHMIAKRVTRKQAAASLAAQAPDGWTAPTPAKRPRKKLADERAIELKGRGED